MPYVNLTRNEIVVLSWRHEIEDWNSKTELGTFKPDGSVAQAPRKVEADTMVVDGIPLCKAGRVIVAGLPAPALGVKWIVDREVWLAVPHRSDVVTPLSHQPREERKKWYTSAFMYHGQ